MKLVGNVLYEPFVDRNNTISKAESQKVEANTLARFGAVDQYRNNCKTIYCSNAAGLNPVVVEGSDKFYN
jgi:hypothetical protein